MLPNASPRAGARRYFRDTLDYGKAIMAVSIVPHTTSAWRRESWSARLSKLIVHLLPISIGGPDLPCFIILHSESAV